MTWVKQNPEEAKWAGFMGQQLEPEMAQDPRHEAVRSDARSPASLVHRLPHDEEVAVV